MSEATFALDRDGTRPGAQADRAPLLESNSVNFVPHAQRYGSPRSLFSLWFAANASGVTLLTGAIAALSGLNLAWSGLAIVLGTVVGCVFVAYHSAQGPVLGLPQMIQSRAQFGILGANLPLMVVVAMYLGFFAGGAVLAGEAFSALVGGPVSLGILVTSVAAVALTIFGYKVMHVVAKVMTPIFILALVALSIVTVVNWPHDASATVPTGFSATGFFLVLGIVAAYHITYGPYVADYSRYLPARSKAAPTFWWTYGGVVLSGIWIMVLGAGVQFAYPKLGTTDALAAMAGTAGGFFRALTLVVFVLGLVNIGGLNIYGAAMSTITIATSFARNWTPNRSLRLAFMIPIGVIGTLGSVVMSGNLITSYEDFIFFLIAFLIPWSAVNLADFYVVRKAHYKLDDLFSTTGEYGTFNRAGLGAYLIGCLAILPFIDTSFYTGFLAKDLGFDISWIVGLVLPAVLYVIFARGSARRAARTRPAALPDTQPHAGVPGPALEVGELL
jgi:nucleobase:cation symporter-1, NCS1 family